MTVKQMAEVVGKECMVKVFLGSDPLVFPARILDARSSYGRTDYRITPTGGSGETWVSAERVTVVSGNRTDKEA
jgi:hypothetical protein